MLDSLFLVYSGLVLWIGFIAFILTRLIFGKNWLVKLGITMFLGPGLKSAVKKLLQESEQKAITQDTLSEVAAHVFWRLTRIGLIGMLIAGLPIWLLMQQNKLIKSQNELFSFQNKRIDTQTILDSFQTILIQQQTDLLRLQDEKFGLQNQLITDQNQNVATQTGLFREQNGLVRFQNMRIDSQINLMTFQNILLDTQTNLFGKQTKLFGTQVSQIDEQNRLLLRQDSLTQQQIAQVKIQNELLDKQTYLSEADRRSSLNFLLGNLLDQINAELKGINSSDRSLSDETIGRIAGLSQSFKPYRYLQVDTLISKPLSPERGQLLIALVNSNLSKETYEKIFESSDFSSAALQGAHLSGSLLSREDFNDVDVLMKYLIRGIPHENEVNWRARARAHLRGANLRDADLSNANLSGADLSGAINITIDQLSTVASLFNCKGLPEEMEKKLREKRPYLFADPDK